MDYFKEIGESLSARCGDGELGGGNFPELAAAVLAEFPIPADIGIEFMADWAPGREQLPEQINFHSGFGGPPLVVYEEPRFYAEVLFCFHGRTSIHSHDFTGLTRCWRDTRLRRSFYIIETRNSNRGSSWVNWSPLRSG